MSIILQLEYLKKKLDFLKESPELFTLEIKYLEEYLEELLAQIEVIGDVENAKSA